MEAGGVLIIPRISTVVLATAAALVPVASRATTPPTYPPAWQSPPHSANTTAPRHHWHRRVSRHPATPAPHPDRVVVDQLRTDLAAVRRELEEVRAQVSAARVPLPGWEVATLVPAVPIQVVPGLAPALPTGVVPTLPQPVPAARAAASEAIDRVREARAYLVLTATVGYTMARQTPEVAIGRLHPEFVVRLAEAVRRARAAGLAAAGVFSAYRPPAFGVGGFSDKFNSLHSYGLAADIAGIGRAGSTAARTWWRIVSAVGLYLPYGPANRAEFNHTQLVPNRVAAQQLRGTITRSGPGDIDKMWAASGVPIPREPAPAATASRLLEIDW